MKKIIVGLVAGFFLVSAATALTVESDAYSTNKGGTKGKFTKTKTPLSKLVRLNGWETKITSTDAGYTAGYGTAEARMVFVAGATPATSYVYIIGKTTAGTQIFRTLGFGTSAGSVASSDAYAPQ